MRKTFIIAFALLTLSLPLFAQLPPGKWWRRPEVINQLSLSEEQQGRLDRIFSSAANTLIDARGEQCDCRLPVAGARAVIDGLQRRRLACRRCVVLGEPAMCGGPRLGTRAAQALVEVARDERVRFEPVGPALVLGREQPAPP